MKNAVVLMFENVEELEAIAPIDILKRAGANVKTASLEDSLKVKGRSCISLLCDCLFCDIKNEDFDIVVVPGGPGTNNVIANVQVAEFLQRHNKKGACIAAICAAPVILKYAGILDGKKCTAHTSRIQELENYSSDEAVVCDGNIITSRGAGTAIDFALEIVAKNFSAETLKEVASSICFAQ